MPLCFSLTLDSVVLMVVVVLKGKADLSAFKVDDVDKAGGARGGVGGLEH